MMLRPVTIFYNRVHDICGWVFAHTKGEIRQAAFRVACWAFNRECKRIMKS